MSKIRECFVCATLLAQTERQRVEVRHRKDKMLVAEVCQACWWKVRALTNQRVKKNGKVYEVRVRRLQLPLFRDTAREVISGGRVDG